MKEIKMSPDVAYCLWAKSDPCHELWRHLLDVAAMAEALWKYFGPLENMPASWVAYICGLHDIGKADPYFQNKNEELAAELRHFIEIPSREDPDVKDSMTPPQRLFRHEARSKEWVHVHLTRWHGWDDEAAGVVAMALSGHHGTFGESPYNEKREWPQQYSVWQPLRQSLADMLWDVLQPEPYAPEEFEEPSTTGMILSGFVILADWLASNHEVFDYQSLHSHTSPEEYYRAARALADSVIEKMGFKEVRIKELLHPRFTDVWPELKKELRPTQQALQNLIVGGGIPPGLAIIEAQMGEGKTESAIYLKEHWNALCGTNGAYIALPTQATSNQMYGRYNRYLDGNKAEVAARLVHGMAWLLDDVSRAKPAVVSDSSEEDEGVAKLQRQQFMQWFRPLRRALLAREGVGTVDQVLMAALNVKFGSLRLLGLRSKVLIIDEVHAYDAYMNAILKHLLEWCRALRIPVILLSATLSRRQKQELIEAYGDKVQALQEHGVQEAYPLLTFVPLDDDHFVQPVPVQATRTVKLVTHYNLLDDARAIARHALERIRNGGCACVLMNSVKGAQDVWRGVAELLQKGEFEALQKDDLILFHARFRAVRRQDIEKLIEAKFGKGSDVEDGTRPKRALVIGTQVLEQSLDVDFDFFITQLAPIDLLLQRSGRLWRHTKGRTRRTAQPELEILLPAEGSLEFGISQKIYARAILLRTLCVLHDVSQGEGQFSLPADFRPLIEAVYGNKPEGATLVPKDVIEKADSIHAAEMQSMANKAKIHLLPSPTSSDFDMSVRSAQESDEQEGANYLRASTRLGDLSRPALLLRNERHITIAQAAAKRQRPPHRTVQQAIFRQKVNVPTWWLNDRKGGSGYKDIIEGEGWLANHLIIPLRGDEWQAASGGVIRDDEHLGVYYVPPQKTSQDIEAGEEADAGYTN